MRPRADRRARLHAAIALIFGGAIILLPGSAAAHSGTGLPGGLEAGLLHPLTGPDHMLAMVAVGIWGSFLGPPMVARLPVVFPAFMAFGALLGIWDVPLPPVEFGIALSVIALGGLIAAGVRLPPVAACLVIGLFGLFHGHAHGSELPAAADPAGYSLGFVAATGCLHVAGISLGLLRKFSWGSTLLRITGALFAVVGCGFLATAIAG